MKQAPLRVFSTVVLTTLTHLSNGTAAVEVDQTFNAHVSGTVHAIAVAPGGKILVGGEFNQVNSENRANLARLESDGKLDPGFNVVTDGAVLSISFARDYAIYAGGAFNSPSRHLLKLSPDGSVDVALNLGAKISSRIDCIAVDVDGAVAIGGPFRRIDGQPAHYVGKLNSTGAVDGQFQSGLLPSFSLEAGVDTIALQSDGKVLVGGNFNTPNGPAFLVRLNSDGSLDSSFSGHHGAMLYPKAIVVLGDGRILVGGTASSSGDGFVRRLHADGSVDATFQAPAFDRTVEAIALTPDGTILTSGGFTGKLARLNADGSNDNSWALSADGVVKVIVVQNDTVLVGGAFSRIGTIERKGIARLNMKTPQQAFATNANGRFIARLAGEQGSSYDIEASSDLQNWSPIANVIATSAGLEVTDENPTTRRHRFFRARLVAPRLP